MKKYFYSLFAAAALILSATSCSQEEDFPGGNGQEVDVTFAVKTSDATATRAIAEGVEVGGGNMANHLIYAVYNSADKNGKALIQNKVEENPEKDGEFQVTVPLVKGIEYDIVFFAYNEEGNAFGINKGNARDKDLTELTLQDVKANQEAYDAFYKVLPKYKAGSASETVYLNRPFAQLNVGTTLKDLANAADLDVFVAQSSVSVKGIYTKFNARTGEVSEPAEVVYALSDVLKKTGNNFQGVSEGGDTFDFTNEKFNVSGKTDDYYYLALAYVLAETPATLNEVSVSFFQDGATEAFNTITVPSLTLQRNWRTNIIGNLLTSSNSFEIVIDEVFKGDHNYEVWDGKTTTEPKQENNTYYITNAAEYAWLVDYCNSTAITGTVEIQSDIDLGGYSIKAIVARDGELTINGNGKTIANANIISGDNDNGTRTAGLFVSLPNSKMTINKLNAKNLNAVAGDTAEEKDWIPSAGVICGYVEGELTLNEVNVLESKAHGLHSIGGLLGFVAGTANATITDCSVDGVTLTDSNVDGESGAMGAIVGRSAGVLTITNTSASNSVIEAYIGTTDSQKRSVAKYVGNFVGGTTESTTAAISVTNGSIDNVTIDLKSDKETYSSQVCAYGDFLGGWRYQYGTVTINGVEITKAATAIDTADELAAALKSAQDGDVIGFSGNITTTSLNASGKNVTIVGMTEDATLDASSASNYVTVSGDVTFKNLTFKFGQQLYYNNGISGSGKLTFENCDFEGIATAMNGDFTYNDCTFTNDQAGNYAAWVYSGTVTYNNCTFTGVNRAAKVYCESGNVANVTYNNCTFNASNVTTKAVSGNKAAIEVAANLSTEKPYVVTINNAKVNNLGIGEYCGDSDIFNIEYVKDGIITADATFGNAIVTVDDETYAVVCKEAAIKEVMKMNSKNITMMLCRDASLDNSTNTVWGGAATETIKIGSVSPNNDEKYKLTLSNSYRDYIQTAGAKVVLEGVELATVDTKSTHWHDYAPKFMCDVDMNGVNMLNSFCFEKTAVLKNITVAATWPTEVCAMWITSGADVTIDGMTVNTKRGIKITDEDSSAAKTILNVSNATFETSAKAAILATTKYGADITLSNVNIEEVAADTKNAVWVDEDRAEYADLVTVTGGSMIIEGNGYKESGNVVAIWSAEGMKKFAEEVNTKKNTFKGKTVKLVADIDLNNDVWTPVGQTGATVFQGTFDGQNHTIKNLNIDSESQTDGHYSSGLFGWGEANGFTVKNVTVDGATVKGHHNVGVIVGYYYGTVDNCHVKNAILTCTKANDDANGDKCGAIAGYVGEATSKLTNCTAVDCSISAGRDAGQIAGAAVSSVVVNCSATRVAVTSNGTSTGANIRNEVIGRVL